MPEETNQEVQGEEVPLHEASLAEINAALEEAQKEEEQNPVVEEAPALEEDPSASPASETTGESLDGVERQPAQAVPSPSPGVAPGGAPPSPGSVAQPNVGQGQGAEDDAALNAKRQADLFVQRRKEEFSSLQRDFATKRQNLEKMKESLAGGLRELYEQDPVKGTEAQLQLQRVVEAIDELDSREQRLAKVVEAQTTFVRHVGPSVSLEDLAEVLRGDGVGEEFVSQFIANPWEFTTEEALVQMGRRALDRKNFIQADTNSRILAKHVLYLNSEIEKLRAKPGRVMAQIKKNLSQQPPVTSAGSSVANGKIHVDPTVMSMQEINEQLARGNESVN